MKIGIAISTFKRDDKVKHLLKKIKDEAWPTKGILVVDSLGSGNIDGYIKEQGWADVFYYNHEHNLGAAGNIRRRVEISAARGWDFVLALNDDSLMTRDSFEKLLSFTHLPNIGALFPLRYYPVKKVYGLTGLYEPGLSGTRKFKNRPNEQLLKVRWSSSNGALYSLAPTKKGVLPDTEVWMCWEDYLYSKILNKNGFDQFIVTDALCDDPYEHTRQKIGPFQIVLSDKPVWYHYYGTRNLIYTALWIDRSPILFMRFLARSMVLAGGVILGWKTPSRLTALFYIVIGVAHGIQRKMGKWRVP